MPIQRPRSLASKIAAGRDQGVLAGMAAIEPRKSRQAGRKPRREPELREQITLFYWLRHYAKRDAAFKWVHSIPNGLPLSPKVAEDASASGLTAGVWDCFIPRCRDGKPGMYLEMKFGTNDLSEEQILFRDDVLREGYVCVVCWCWVDAFAVIVKYLGIRSPTLEKFISENRIPYRRVKPPRYETNG